MGYARHVGRVGALAVALGVGTAVAVPQTAWADDSGADGKASSQSAESSPKSSSKQTESSPQSTKTDKSDDDESRSDTGEDADGDGDNDGDVDADGDDDANNDDGDAEGDAGIDDDTVDDSSNATNDPDPLPPPTPPDVDADSRANEPITKPAATTAPPGGNRAPAAIRAQTDVESFVAQATSPAQPDAAAAGTIAPAPTLLRGASTQALAVTTAAPAPPPPADPVSALLAAPATLIVSLASAIVSPFLGGPAIPAPPPTLFAVLAFVRREITRTFFNSTPVAQDQNITLVLDEPDDVSAPIAFTATDADGDGLAYAVPARGAVGGASRGTVVVDSATGTFTYNPDDSFALSGGTDTFTVTVSDAASRRTFLGFPLSFSPTADTAVVTISLARVDRAPTAVGDAYTVSEDGRLVVPRGAGVLANDTDPDRDPLTARLVDDVEHGTLSFNTDGSFAYTPDADYSGTDSFTYRANDGALDSNIATVTITVTAVNDAPVAGVQGPQTVDLATGAVSGTVAFTDPDGDPLTYIVTQQPARGTLTLNSTTGVYTYTPVPAERLIANTTSAVEQVSFVVSASDGSLSTATTTTVVIDPARLVVTDTISLVNAANPTGSPIGIAASPDGRILYVANRDGARSTVSVIDAATGTVTATIAVTNGSNPENLAVSPDGRFVYVANNSGTVSIIDTATNQLTSTTIAVGGGTRGIITVVTANGTRAYVARQDLDGVAVVDITAGSATVNTVIATIPVGDAPLSLVASPDGRFVYVGNVGADTVSVIDTATDAVLTTIAVGDGPQGIGISPDGRTVYTANNSAGTVSVINTATNAVVATITVGTGPRGVRVSPDGSYALVTNLNGSTVSVVDTATNTVIGSPIAVGSIPQNIAFDVDGNAYTTNFGNRNLSVLSIVSANLNAPPFARTNGYSVAEDGTLTVTGRGVLDNDIDPDGDAVTAALVSGPANGTLTLNANGSFTYRPAADFNGVDRFTYRASDGTLFSAPAAVSITVTAVNDAPVVITSPGATNFVENGSPVVIDSGLTVTDVDSATLTGATVSITGGFGPGDTLASSSLTGVSSYNPVTGVLTLSGTFSAADYQDRLRTVTFNTPGDNPATALRTITFVVNDGARLSMSATKQVTVTAVNDAPVAADLAITTNEDTPVTATLPVTDVDSPNPTITIVTGPRNGTVTLGAGGTFTYRPNANYLGVDFFTYTASDGTLSSDIATVTVNVVNAPPSAMVIAQDPNAVDGAVIVTVTGTDPAGAVTISPQAGVTPIGDPVTVGGVTTAMFQYRPTAAERDAAAQTAGIDTRTLTFVVTDAAGVSVTTDVVVTIAPLTVVRLANGATPLTDFAVDPATGIGYQVIQQPNGVPVVTSTERGVKLPTDLVLGATVGGIVFDGQGNGYLTALLGESLTSVYRVNRAGTTATFTQGEPIGHVRVVDGVAYQAVADGSTTTVYRINADMTTTSVRSVSVPEGLTVDPRRSVVVYDPRTDTVYQSFVDTRGVGNVLSFGPAGEVVGLFDDRPATGGVVIDTTTGGVYQTFGDATSTVVRALVGRGGLFLSAAPVGSVVTAPDGSLSQTGTFVGSDGSISTAVTTTDSRGFPRTLTIPGTPAGAVVVDRATGVFRQVTVNADGTSTVTTIGRQGSVTLAGTAVGAVVLAPDRPGSYYVTARVTEAGDSATAVTRFDSDGTRTTVTLPGTASSAVAVDARTGVVYQSTDRGIYVALPGSSPGSASTIG